MLLCISFYSTCVYTVCWLRCISVGQKEGHCQCKPLAAANYTHYSAIAGCRKPTFPTDCRLSSLLSNTETPAYYYKISHKVLSPSVTLWNCCLISLLSNIYLFCDPSPRSALVHYKQKEVNQLMMQCHWSRAEARGEREGEGEKDAFISAKIVLQTRLPLFRLQNEMQHHKFCLKWNRLIWICWPGTLFMFLGRASDNVTKYNYQGLHYSSGFHTHSIHI